MEFGIVAKISFKSSKCSSRNSCNFPGEHGQRHDAKEWTTNSWSQWLGPWHHSWPPTKAHKSLPALHSQDQQLGWIDSWSMVSSSFLISITVLIFPFSQISTGVKSTSSLAKTSEVWMMLWNGGSTRKRMRWRTSCFENTTWGCSCWTSTELLQQIHRSNQYLRKDLQKRFPPRENHPKCNVACQKPILHIKPSIARILIKSLAWLWRELINYSSGVPL